MANGSGATGAVRWARVLAPLLILALLLAFWKLRMIDAAYEPLHGPVSIDVSTDHLPAMSHIFSELAAGRLPLWNPYQMAGLPLLAVPLSGVFYPPNGVYALFATPLAIELSLLLHTLFGIAGMLLLLRHLGLGALPGLAGALTFVWSGHAVSNWIQPIVLAATMWFPWLAWLLLKVIAGSRLAWLGLVAAVALQWFVGATEVTVHSLEAGALVALVALVALARRKPGAALGRAAWVAGAVALGSALAAVQLLPSIELVGESVRGPGKLSIDEVAGWRLGPKLFFSWTLGDAARPTPNLVGLLPFLGLALGFGVRGARAAWIAAVGLAAAGALLVFGGDVFRFYASLPFGTLFRRPSKFVDIYSFGAAWLAALAVEGLLRRSGLTARALLRDPGFVIAAAASLAAAVWALTATAASPVLLAAPVCLAGFALAPRPAWRTAAVAGLVGAQALQLFLAAGSELRPWHRRKSYTVADAFWSRLGDKVGDGRVHVSSRLRWEPPFMPRQGMLQRVDVLGDYQPLVPQRYADYLGRATPDNEAGPYFGRVQLGPATRWPMLDLAGARLFVVESRREARRLGMDPSRNFELVHADPSGVLAYERGATLPRAWWVERAWVAGSADEALELVSAPGFRPRETVVLEEAVAGHAPADRDGVSGRGTARVLSREPEEVVVEVTSDRPGFLVLADFHWPGWQAFSDGEELPVLRANHLFRAVQLPPGTHQVRFVYRPGSLRSGAAVSLAALVTTLVAAALARKQKRGLPDAVLS